MSAYHAIDAANDIIERLALDFAADAMGESRFLETQNIPPRLAGHLVVAALSRASIKVQRKVDEVDREH
jgi:hypothetical protein